MNRWAPGPTGWLSAGTERRPFVLQRRWSPVEQARVAVDANGPGALDGIKVEADGNLWCGFGSNGSTQASPMWAAK